MLSVPDNDLGSNSRCCSVAVFAFVVTDERVGGLQIASALLRKQSTATVIEKPAEAVYEHYRKDLLKNRETNQTTVLEKSDAE